MVTTIEKTIDIACPVDQVYNQWTKYEQFPRFMSSIDNVEQTSPNTVSWQASIAGVKREWDSNILEQVPNQKISWAATDGTINSGTVYFQSKTPTETQIKFHLEYEPEGVMETLGGKTGIIERQTEKDLERFKEIMEASGFEETGTPAGLHDQTTTNNNATPGQIVDQSLDNGGTGIPVAGSTYQSSTGNADTIYPETGGSPDTNRLT